VSFQLYRCFLSFESIGAARPTRLINLKRCGCRSFVSRKPLLVASPRTLLAVGGVVLLRGIFRLHCTASVLLTVSDDPDCALSLGRRREGRNDILEILLHRLSGSDDRCTVLLAVVGTLAYLEVNRDSIKAERSWSWPLRTRKPQPIDAEFKEVADPTEKPSKKPGKSVRLIKGGEQGITLTSTDGLMAHLAQAGLTKGERLAEIHAAGRFLSLCASGGRHPRGRSSGTIAGCRGCAVATGRRLPL